jgi:hypothetical protein
LLACRGTIETKKGAAGPSFSTTAVPLRDRTGLASDWKIIDGTRPGVAGRIVFSAS